MEKVKKYLALCLFMCSFNVFSMREAVHEPVLREPAGPVVEPHTVELPHRLNPFNELLSKEPTENGSHVLPVHMQGRPGTPDSLIDDTPPASPGVAVAHEGSSDDEGVGVNGAAAIARIAAQRHNGIEMQRPTVRLSPDQEHIEILEMTIAHLRALPVTSEEESARVQAKITQLEQLLAKANQQKATIVEPVVTPEPLAVVAKEAPKKDEIIQGEAPVISQKNAPKKQGGVAGLKTAYAINRVWLQKSVQIQAKVAFKGDYKAQVAKIVAEMRAGKAPAEIFEGLEEVNNPDACKGLIARVYDILVKQKLRTQAMITASEETVRNDDPFKAYVQGLEQGTSAITYADTIDMYRKDELVQVKPRSLGNSQKSSFLQKQLTKRAVNIVMENPTVTTDLGNLVSGGTVDAHIGIRLQVAQTIVVQLRAGELPIEVVDSVKNTLTNADVTGVEESAIKQVVADIFTVMRQKKLMTKKMKAAQQLSEEQLKLMQKGQPKLEKTDSGRSGLLSHDAGQSPVASKGQEPIVELSPAEQFKQKDTGAISERIKANEADIEKLLGKDGEVFVNALQGRLAQTLDENLTKLDVLSRSLVTEWRAFLDTLGDNPQGRLQALQNYLKGKGFPDGVDIVEFQRQANALKDLSQKRDHYKALLEEIKKQIARVRELLEKQRLADLKAKNTPQVEAYKKELNDQLQGVKNFLALPENQALLENSQYGEFKDIIDSWVYRIDFNNKLRVTLFDRSLSNPDLEDQIAQDKQEVDGIEQRIRNAMQQAKVLDSTMHALQELVVKNSDLKQQLDALLMEAERARTTGLAQFSTNVATLGPKAAVEQLEKTADEVEAYKNRAEELIGNYKLKAIQVRKAQRQLEKAQEEKAILDAIRTKRDQITALVSENAEALAVQPTIAEQVEKLQSTLISTANVLLGEVKVGMSAYEINEARANFDIKFTEFTSLINEANRTYGEQKAAEAAQKAAQAAAQEALEKAQVEETARLKQQPTAQKPKKPKKIAVISPAYQSRQNPLAAEPLVASKPKEPSDTLQKGLGSARKGLNEIGQNLKGFWKRLTAKSGEEAAPAQVEYKTYPTNEDRQVAVGLLSEEVSKQKNASDLGTAKEAVELLAQEVDFTKAVILRAFTDTAQEKAYKKAMASLWLQMASPEVNLVPEQSEQQFNANLLEAYSLLDGLNDDGRELLRRSFAFIRDGQELSRDIAQDGIKDLAVVAKTLTNPTQLYAFARDHKELLNAKDLDSFKDAIRALLKDKNLEALQEPMDVVLWRILTDQGDLAKKMFDNLQLQELVTANESKVTASWAQPLLRKAFMKVSRDDQTTPFTDLMTRVVTELNSVANQTQLKKLIDIQSLDVTTSEKFVASVKTMIKEVQDNPVMKTVWQVILGNSAALDAVFLLAQKAKQQKEVVTKGGAARSAQTGEGTKGKPGLTWKSFTQGASNLAARAKEGASKLATKANKGMQELADRLDAATEGKQ